MRGRRRFLGLLFLGLAGCAAPVVPTPTPILRREDLRPSRPTPRPTPTTYPSGGLGLYRWEWEILHGNGRNTAGRFVSYENGKLGVAFANDLVFYMERSWGDMNAVSFEAARDETKLYMPPDAEHVWSYETRWSRKVDLYKSQSLLNRFAEARVSGDSRINPWTGVEPGTFIAFYREIGDKVVSIGLATGNNP